MAESSLDSLRGIRDVHVEWKAFELRPGGVFPGTPEEEARYRDYIYQKHEAMWDLARERFGLEMVEGPWGVNSRLALEGAVFARNHDREEAYHRACFRAHWQESQRLDDPQVLGRIAHSVDLPQEAFEAAIAERHHRAAVDEDLALARAYGVTAIPTMIFAQRYLVSGAQPVDVLAQVVDRCLAEGLV